MDLVINLLIGVLSGTAVAAYNMSRPAQLWKLIIIGIIGAWFPSIDEITLWSSFDAVVGTALGLTSSGTEIYFGKFWYSHQAFFHSIFSVILFSVLLALAAGWFYRYILKGASTYARATRYCSIYAIVFGLAYLLHLGGDLVAPGGPWGGIRLFFPFEVYIGGWGFTWWWNNYDLALILLVCSILNIAFIYIIPPLRKGMRQLPGGILILAVLLIGVQLGKRDFDFNRPGYSVREHASKEIQRHMLGESLFSAMEEVDETLPIYF